MTLGQAQLLKHDSLILTKIRGDGSYDEENDDDDDAMSPMIEKASLKPPQFLERDSITLARKSKPLGMPQLLERDSVTLTKKKTPGFMHDFDDGTRMSLYDDIDDSTRMSLFYDSTRMSLIEETKPFTATLNDVSNPPEIKKRSLNSIFKEVSLKHGIPESHLDRPLMSKQDSVVLTKRRSPEVARGNHQDDNEEECPKPDLREHDSLALVKKRNPNLIHSS